MRAENPECSGRQLGDKWETKVRNPADQSTQSIESVLGDTGRQAGDKPENTRAKNPECGRKLGDKCEIALRASRVHVFCGKPCGPSMHPLSKEYSVGL